MSQSDDERERYFWDTLRRLSWSSLVVLLVFGVLTGLTLLFAWQPYLPLSFLGVLAGLTLSFALRGSARTREITGLILGALVLPVFAVYLGGIAARDAGAFPRYGATLSAFLTHATVATLTVPWISRLWRRLTPPVPGRLSADASARTTGAAP